MTLTELAFIYGACGLCIGIVCLLVDHYHHPQSRKENMNAPKSTVVQDVVLPDLDYSGSTTRMLAENDVIPIRPKDIRDYAINQRETLRLRERQLLSALTQLAELRAVSEWVEISKEGLPEAMKDVQVGAEGLSVRPMFYSGTNHANSASGELEPLWICCITGKKYTWPTHWQPLPPAPQPSPASAVKGE